MARLVTVGEQVINGKKFAAGAVVGEVEGGVIQPVAEVTVGDVAARLRRKLVEAVAVVKKAVETVEKKESGPQGHGGEVAGGLGGKKAKR